MNKITNIKMDKKILITGATGFVGRNLAKELVSRGYETTILVRNIEKSEKIKELQKTTKILFSLEDKKIEINDSKILIHCAWENVKNINDMTHIEKQFLSHYKFIKKMIESGIKKVVVTGTCYEYGLQYGPIQANAVTKPNTPYALSKDYLHKSLQLLKKDYEFELIWARLFYIYGEGQNQKSILPQLDAAIKKSEKDFNMSLGEQLFDYSDVKDVAKKIANLLQKKNGTYNICSGKPISLRRLVEIRILEKNSKIKLNLGYYNYRPEDSIAIWGIPGGGG